MATAEWIVASGRLLQLEQGFKETVAGLLCKSSILSQLLQAIDKQHCPVLTSHSSLHESWNSCYQGLGR